MPVRDTSLDAYVEHGDSGQLGRQQWFLMMWFHRTGKQYTRRELAEETGMLLSSICGRVNELIELGYLEDAPRRPCQVTGKSAHVVRVKPRQLSLLEAA